MPTYNYKAKKQDAQNVTGQIVAQSEEEAIELISQQGLLPVSLQEHFFKGDPLKGFTPQRVKPKELYLFSRQLMSLLKGGLTLLRALEIIETQLTNSYFGNVVHKMIERIRDGSTFSDCLKQYPHIFSPLFVAMIKVGEESGNLKEMLRTISEYQRNQNEVSDKVKSALVYPIFMSCVGAGTVFFILTFVMPRIGGLLTSLGGKLPAPTQFLLSASTFFQTMWWAILLGCFVLFILVSKWSKTENGRSTISHTSLALPLLGPFFLKVEISRFCRTLEMLLKSGVSILKALQLAIPVLDNTVIRQEFHSCQQSLAAGDTLAASLKSSRLLPAVMIHLIAVGEESGGLADSLGDIADSYEQETNELIKVMTTILEPSMILVVGGVIGFLVLAMLLPVFQIDVFAR